MIEHVKLAIESITPQNGYAIYPRQVVLVSSADELQEHPARAVSIIQDTQGCCGVLLNVSPGATEASLRQSIKDVLSSDFTVNEQAEGLPLLVSDPKFIRNE